MGFAPRIYEVHVWEQDEYEDWWWEPLVGYENYSKALETYNKMKSEGNDVRIVETKVVRAWEDGIEYT